ncbi:MAG: sulfurtransferase [Bacteroidetes bacterium 4572_112]|nr:MAG: sulfurtransferase [Bacteroidetes bacterium 4572_112]
MGPLFPQELISEEINILIGFFIGIGFGFLLEAAGFTNTRKLAGVFYGYDFVVLKVFFSAAITAAIIIFFLNHFGIMDISLTFYPKTYWIPTLIGGLIMAFGFIIGGFCPGTSVCAAVTGKIDAMIFVGGALIGIFGYAFTYDSVWKELRGSGAMGKVNIAEWMGMSDGLFILLLTVIAAVAFFAVSIIQKKVVASTNYKL